MDVPFDCLACGACCLHAGGVLLLDQDVARLAAHLGLTEAEVRIRTKGRDDPACVFLDWQSQLAGGTRCTVYEARPQVCRDYPVGGAACLRERKNIGLPTAPQPPGQTPST
mgnify:CR=1 FL=1